MQEGVFKVLQVVVFFLVVIVFVDQVDFNLDVPKLKKKKKKNTLALGCRGSNAELINRHSLRQPSPFSTSTGSPRI